MKLTVPSFKVSLIAFVVVSFLLSASGAFLVYRTGQEVGRNDKADSARTDCNTLYNELNGKARDERAEVAGEQTTADKAQIEAEIVVWQNLLTQFTTPQSGTDAEQLATFVGTINDQIQSLQIKLQALKDLEDSRLEFPYPAPDACDDSVITKEEGNVISK